MQELETIFWQRNADITKLKEQNKQAKKQEFQQRERLRIQRQNWVIKIVKTIKILTTENKKNIYSCVVRMMQYYGEQLGKIESQGELDLEKNFTEAIINLFIAFYSKYCYGDIATVKKIVRPNNAFIVIDLVKQLIETHRQYFRVKIMQSYKQGTKLNISEDRPKVKHPPVQSLRREVPLTQPSQSQHNQKQQVQESLQVYDRVKHAVYEKWQNLVNYNLPTEQNLKNYINDAYLELLERNSQNNFAINKFQQKCFGKARTFVYNVSSLYTQEEIKKMQSKLRYDIAQKFASIQELKGDPSADQLKQYFKIKLQIQESQDKINSKKLNEEKVNQWVPIVVQKSGFQHCPLNLYIYFGRDLVPIEQLGVRCGLSLKNYLKLIIKNRMEEDHVNQIIESKYFRRHHFIDLNHAKKKQLMTYEHRVYDKSKKQSIFPILRSNELRQQAEIAIKNRSFSEHKLLPLLKSQMLPTKIQEVQNQFKQNPLSNIARMQMKFQSSIRNKLSFQKKNEENSQLKSALQHSKELAKAGKSKIDNIIELIINQRNMTVPS